MSTRLQHLAFVIKSNPVLVSQERCLDKVGQQSSGQPAQDKALVEPLLMAEMVCSLAVLPPDCGILVFLLEEPSIYHVQS